MSARDAWVGLDPVWQECFRLAWEAFQEGSTPVGAVLVSADGTVVRTGRNRHNGRTGYPAGELAGSNIAYAEINALATLPFGSYTDHVLYTTLEPCLLCAAALRYSHIGAGPYLDAVDQHPALGICFDTCHIWAAGHDLASPGGMTAALDLLREVAGPDRLALVHANDSKDGCGSRRDRHENVGAGTLGPAAFAELLAHPTTQGVPVVVETPSEGNAGTGHARDIAKLLSLAPVPATGS